MAGRQFRLTAPVVPEHSLQRAIAHALRLELAPAGRVSPHGVVWFSIDHANYAGEVPEIRQLRGICAGVPDVFLLWRGLAGFIEIKTTAGVLSDAQKSVVAALLAAGGRVAVARDAGEVLATIDRWGIPRAHRLASASLLSEGDGSPSPRTRGEALARRTPVAVPLAAGNERTTSQTQGECDVLQPATDRPPG